MNTNRLNSDDLNQSASDPGDQWITGGECYDASTGNLVEQAWQPASQRSGPRQPLLIRKLRDQIKMARAAKQHIRGPDYGPQSLRKVIPPPRAQADHLDHASDCMPGLSMT
jgi:hypothetical protein